MARVALAWIESRLWMTDFIELLELDYICMVDLSVNGCAHAARACGVLLRVPS